MPSKSCLWANAVSDAGHYFWVMIPCLFFLLFSLSVSACFFGSMFFVGYKGAAVGGGVSMLVMGVISGAVFFPCWFWHRDANRRAKQLWSDMDDRSRAAAQFIRREMELSSLF